MDLGDQETKLTKVRAEVHVDVHEEFHSPKSEFRDSPSPVYRPPFVAFVAGAFVENGCSASFR